MSGADTLDAVQQRSDALERVSDGIVALDDQLRYTYVNGQAGTLLDTDPESLLGEQIWDAFPDTQGTVAEDAIERAVETGQMTSFERYNEQLEKWWKVSVHPDDTGVTIIFDDITAQKERLYELERTEVLFQNTQDGLFVVDVEGGGESFRVNQVNPAYEAFLARRPRSFRAKRYVSLSTRTTARPSARDAESVFAGVNPSGTRSFSLSTVGRGGKRESHP